ncbi:MAG: TIGR00645 family protein [Alphaproteobacteria bacterium]|nr:TIGR00645 family protein [Alphaproteobacteria bacterium]
MLKPRLELMLERGLFASRWLMAPFYVGLVIALCALLVVFFQELFHELPHVLSMTPEDAILLALSLIDLSLAANLLVIVTLSGYENFVSKIDTGAHEDRPEWMGTVDFSGLKMKLIASIVAISAIALLKAFLKLSELNTPIDQPRLLWLVLVHLSFVVSGVLLALMDWLNSKVTKH